MHHDALGNTVNGIANGKAEEKHQFIFISVMQPAGGSINEETFYFTLNDERRCRSSGIYPLFSHLANNGPAEHGVESRGKRVSVSFSRDACVHLR